MEEYSFPTVTFVGAVPPMHSPHVDNNGDDDDDNKDDGGGLYFRGC